MKLNKKNSKHIIAISFLVLALITYFAFSPKSYTAGNINSAIQNANDYLYAQLLPNGKFIYRKHMDPDHKLKRKYNILRHMGSVYSLYMMEAYHPGSLQLGKVKKSIQFIKDAAFEKFDQDKMGIWSQESLSGRDGQVPQTKLGAAGLTLVATAPLQKSMPEVVSVEELKMIGNTIIHMQKDNGSFYSIMYKNGEFDKDWISLYYPGEAIFGLVELYKLTQDEKYLNAALKGMLYLEESRRDLSIKKMLPDHWALIASSKLLELENINSEDRKRIISHAQKVIKLMLSQQIHISQFNSLKGGFSEKGNTTPTSTRIEGLNAMYPHIQDQKLKERTEKGIAAAVNFLMINQLQVPPYQGAWRRSVFKYDIEGYKKLKGKDETYKEQRKHNRRVDEIRIDYVQHALSALIGFQNNFN